MKIKSSNIDVYYGVCNYYYKVPRIIEDSVTFNVTTELLTLLLRVEDVPVGAVASEVKPLTAITQIVKEEHGHV